MSVGTEDEPVVFSSSLEEGERGPGDWGGVVLLGDATVNLTGGTGQIEGIPGTDERGSFGGDNDESDCGTVKYTRIEFTGYVLSGDNELQGLTLGGCGAGTEISYLQVHMSSDDGIEIFGGSPNLDHIVLSSNEDDGFDTANGFTGNVQFLVVQHLIPEPGEGRGFEWDNSDPTSTDEPRNLPNVFNATIVGPGAEVDSTSIVLRRGTGANLGNLLVTGFQKGVDVRDAETVVDADTALVIESSCFYAAEDEENFTEDADMDDDTAFNEVETFGAEETGNIIDMDPELGDASNATAPDFVPAADNPCADGVAPPDNGFFDTSATYMGAFEPGGDDWTAGWTAYPAD
jgi:hypothetical protein